MKLWAMAFLLAFAPHAAPAHAAAEAPAVHADSELSAPDAPTEPPERPQAPVGSLAAVHVTRVSAEVALSLSRPLGAPPVLGAADGHHRRIDRPPTASRFLV